MSGFEREGDQGRWTLRLSGRLGREQRGKLEPLLAEAKKSGARELCFDLQEVTDFDTLGVASLIDAIGWGEKQGIPVKLRSPEKHLLDYLSLLDVHRLAGPRISPDRESFLGHIGRIAAPFIDALKAQVTLFGETVYWVFIGPIKGKGVRWDRVGREITLVGANAVPIVLLISTLMGMILAMQSAVQLRQYGATNLIPDLVAISITRELGPLITAIIVAGRSGSANAAEIGTMVVSEELDAMRQMGVNPARFLFVPKIVSLAIALPCLGILANSIAILSGAIITTSTLGYGLSGYLEETRLALVGGDIYTGLFKCGVFGLIIGATGCGQGMAVKGGAGEVGRATTIAVVISIFFIILADTFFTLLFHSL